MLFGLKSKFLQFFLLGVLVAHVQVEGMNVNTLLQSRIPLVREGLAQSLGPLTEQMRERIKTSVLGALSERYNPKLVTLTRNLIDTEPDAGFRKFLANWDAVPPQECENFNLVLDSLLLCVNGELSKLLAEGKSAGMIEGVEKFDGGYRLTGSNVLCSRSFLRGGWLKFFLNEGSLEVKFAQVDDYKWFINSVEVANLPFLSNAELSSPGTIFSVFGNTEWGVIHSDPSFSLEKALNIGFLSLCAEGEGDRVYNVSIVKRNDGEPFMFVGDLVSSEDLAHNDHFSVDYFSATIDTGTFVNSKKSIQATPGMNFGKACIGFIKGTLEGQVTPRKLKYAIKQNSPISIDGTESAEIPTEEAQ